MADQPLKDWTGKKNLHSSSDWSNSNENPKVTNGESIWLRDSEPREILVNSDSSKDEKLHVGTDPRDQLEVVSLHEPIYANDFAALRGPPVLIRNDTTRNAPSSLESLKKTVLALRNSLMLGYTRKNIISRRGSNWWKPRSSVEVYDFGGDFDHSNEETIRKLKRAKNAENEDEGGSRIFQGTEFQGSYGKQDSKEPHNRSKRSRNFVADSNYTNNRRDIPENNRKPQMIKNVFENATTQNTEKVVMKLYSSYFNDGKNSTNVSNKTNISDSQYLLDEGSLLNNYLNNSTITPSIANKTHISEPRYPSHTEAYLNDYFIDDKSLFVIKTDLQTHSPQRITKSKVPTNSKEISQQSTIETTLKSIEHRVENRAESPDFEKNSFTVPNAFTDPINDIDDSGKFLKNRSGEEKLVVAEQKISRLGMNDGQSKGTEKEIPRGNTSHGFGIATNELWSCVETTMAIREKEIEADGTRKQNREPIPGVIKVCEPRGRPYQKQEAETTTRLSRRMGKDGMSVARMKTLEDEVDKSRNTNAKEDPSTSPIDSVTDAAMKPEAAYINTSETGESIILRNLTSVTVDNDLLKQQQMVPSLSAENRYANKSNGNLDTDRIDIRILGSNGNETMNVKEGTRTTIKAHEYHRSDNNLQRKLLWTCTIPGDGETKRASSSTRSVFNNVSESDIENVTNENRRHSEVIGSANLRKLFTKVNREDKIEGSQISQGALNSQISDTNHYARYKRASIYPYENLESSNEADSENIAVEKEAAINHGEKQESNEDYLNKNVEELQGSYNDREEDIFQDDDKAMESKRGGQSSLRQQIDPIRAKVDMLIKQKLNKKHKDRGVYRKKRHSMLVEYYDYDDDEEQESDAPINQQETRNKDKLSLYAKIRKRDGKSPSKAGGLGKKKNENAEAVMKEELRRARVKNKEPKEEIVIDLGKRKNKTSDRNDKKSFGSLGSSFENVLNEERQLSTEENSDKIDQSKDFQNNLYPEETAAVKSKWLDEPLEDRMALSKKNSEPLEDSCEKKISLNEPSEYTANVDVNPDVIKNILLDIRPIEILEQTRELGASKDFYEDFGDDRMVERSNDLFRRPDDHYYYHQENDSNNIESLYEELKNVYDWPDSELKSGGSRLKGDQRLHYESDDTLDTNPSQLQPLNDRFLGSVQNGIAQRRFQSINASWMSDSEQSSTEENSPNMFSVRPTTESRGSTGQSIIDKDSGSPHENSKYVESKAHEVLKRNLNLEKQSAISSRDLQDESFVESLDWHDDFDDNVRVRLGRGLKAINETVTSDFDKTYDHDDKLDVANATNVNSTSARVSSQTIYDNSSMSQNRHGNTAKDLYDIFNNRDVSAQSVKNVQESILMNTVNMDGDKDLEAAEQNRVNNRTPRIRRAVSYRAFYDDLNQNQRDSDEMGRSLGTRFDSPNILKNRLDGVYRGYETGSWNSDTRDLDQYLKIPRSNTRRKRKPGKKSKKNKHSSGKHAGKSSSRSSSSRNRRHHAHRSDMSENVNRSDLKPKPRNKAEASPLIGRTRIQKSKTAERGLLRAGMNEASGEKVLYENAENQSTVKPEEDGDARRKEITLLLAADNIDDESQMDVALHGELAGKIVEQIFQQVQKNDQLKGVFGPGLHRDHKTEDVITGNTYRQGLDQDGTNHTETIVKRVMGLLGTLILNEVQEKTCISLSPGMREFLGWMLEVDREEESLQEAPPLPLIREKIIPEQDTGHKFLFDSTSEPEGGENINDLQKKVKVLETLVKEYNALTAREKTRVQAVHDYLMRQLDQLLRYIEARETAETKRKPTSGLIGTARAGSGNILQYQSAVPNATNAGHSMTRKDTFSLPIDTHHLFQFNNVSFETTNKRLHDSHAASRHRETRSLDKIPSKRRRHREMKRRKFRNQKKNGNRKKSKYRHNKYRKHLDRAGSLPGYRKSRPKRANPDENDQASLYYLSYEKPRIYDSFDLVDAKLRGRRKKRKRELVGKKNAAIGNDRLPDLLAIKGKNRMEDEVILLNKREAWKRENEEQLEEVAFGKDMRNCARRERERLEKLTEGDKRKPINETSSRMKRENIIRGTSTDKGTNYPDKSHTAFEIHDGGSWNNSEISNNNGTGHENKLELAERRINVFADNKTNAAIDSAAAEASMEEKLATNAGANNQVKGKLGAINRETKIDKADGSTSFVNLTSDAKPPRVSEERQKVSVTEKEADDNAVKLNRATNYRRAEIDPEIELKNRRQGREKRIYDVANWKMTDYFYDDDKLSRNKLREKYVAKLDELGNLDTDPENNLVLLRLRNNKWSNDVVEWRLLPIIKRSPYYDDRALSTIRLMEKETPILSSIKNSPRFWRPKHRRRNGVFNNSPILKIIDNVNFPREIRRKAKQTSEMERFEDSRIDPRIILKVREPSRPRNNKRSNGNAEFGTPFVSKDPNREFREMPRSRVHPELGDRVIYDGVGPQLPVWPYRHPVLPCDVNPMFLLSNNVKEEKWAFLS
ncbi:PREDICTED: uncharacterized protein LOC105565207 [Vollenhovia emeryi]|uniref:uncharacterized protein LOC105565207 n=1 Tax=Vollenhovia emeryi TaxID=411798 RepID=UPI0005F5680F|nr:PREDICTED: uncharacterized protein LOC105565207 [Vollenhovia emeryi]